MRLRAGNPRCRRLPEQDGRRISAPARPASWSKAWPGCTARAHRAAGSHRDRHLCDGGGDDRRRRATGGARPEHLQSALDVLTQAGVIITVTTKASALPATAPASAGDGLDRAFPGFPTDLQAQLMALMACAKDLAHHRNDLRKPLHACAGTGAVRRADSSRRRNRDHRRHRATARAPVMATDLRASVSR